MQIVIRQDEPRSLLIEPAVLKTRDEFEALIDDLFGAAAVIWPLDEGGGEPIDGKPVPAPAAAAGAPEMKSCVIDLPAFPRAAPPVEKPAAVVPPVPSAPLPGRTYERPERGDDKLNDRQKQLVSLLLAGESNETICEKLGITLPALGGMKRGLQRIGAI